MENNVNRQSPHCYNCGENHWPYQRCPATTGQEPDYILTDIGERICRELVARCNEMEYDQYDETSIDITVLLTRRDVEAIVQAFAP